MTRTFVEEVAEQLAVELGGIARALTDVLGTDLALLVEDRLESRCAFLAAEACSEEDDRRAAQAVLTIMFARWPEDTEPPAEWWRTPVGRCCARSFGREGSESVSRSVAAAMLGVHPGTVAQLVHRPGGGLERHPDGGITFASVLARLARR